MFSMKCGFFVMSGGFVHGQDETIHGPAGVEVH